MQTNPTEKVTLINSKNTLKTMHAKIEDRLSLVYDIRPGNEASLFFQGSTC